MHELGSVAIAWDCFKGRCGNASFPAAFAHMHARTCACKPPTHSRRPCPYPQQELAAVLRTCTSWDAELLPYSLAASSPSAAMEQDIGGLAAQLARQASAVASAVEALLVGGALNLWGTKVLGGGWLGVDAGLWG